MKRKLSILLLALLPLLSQAETEKKRPWLVAPMVTSSPAFGNGGGAVGMVFFKPDKNDTNSPASSVTAMGLYSDTKSHFAGIFARTFWKEDTWRITTGIANPKINNDFNYEALSGDIEFTTTIVALGMRVDRRVFGDFFFGVRGRVVDENYSDANVLGEAYFTAREVEDSTAGQLGVVASYDSRDHVRYPTRGNQSELGYMAVPEEFGAPESYHIVEGFSNQFIPLLDSHVLALRLYGRFTPSGTPYSGLTTLGRRSDLRGYTAGEKVAENLIALQSEYRVMFTKKVGAAAFFGISELYNGNLGNINSDTFYPAGGIGFRYMMNTENKMNFRFDYAWGSRDERGFYVSVGEAF